MRRGAAATYAVAGLAVLVLGAGVAAGALVGFSAETQTQTSTFPGGWVAAPSAVQTPSPSGYGAVLSWTPGTHGVTGQSLYSAGTQTTSSCAAAQYTTPISTTLATTVTTATDTTPSSSANGLYGCYQLQSTHGSWSRGTSFPVVRLGLVPLGIAAANCTSSCHANTTENGDTITLSFNQAVTYTGSSISVCTFTNGTMLLGDSCAASTDTPSLGRITGLTIAANKSYPTSTVAPSGSTIVVTLGGSPNKTSSRTSVTGTGTFTYTGSATLVQSSNGTPPASVCTASNCTWTWSGNF